MAFRDVMKGGICPQIEVSFDWQNDPTSGTQTWTDVTPYLVSYSRNPVRTNEFDQPGPATATLVLRNDDARFIPDNASGPYFGGLKKYRRIRVRAQWAGVTYGRFWGYVVDWPQTWDAAGKNQYVTLQLIDNLAPFETYDLQGQSFASKLSGPAIQDVFMAVQTVVGGGFTFSTSLDAGNSTIAASGILGTGSWALQRLKDIAASENGVIFADGSGVIQFHDRHRRLTGGVSVNVQAVIGDGPGEIPYRDPQPEFGDAWPVVQVTSAGGTVQQASAAAGVASFFPRVLNFPTGGTYLVASAAEALSAAQYLANRYGQPVTRIKDMTVLAVQSPTAYWPAVLALDTSSKVMLRRRPLVNGAPTAGTVSLTQFVEGYGDDVKVGEDWKVHLPLSPADLQSYWVLGDAVYGLLGQTTKLGY